MKYGRAGFYNKRRTPVLDCTSHLKDPEDKNAP